MKYIVILSLAATVAGCAAPVPGPVENGQKGAAVGLGVDAATLAQGVWEPVSINGHVLPQPTTQKGIRFTDGRIEGDLNCNSFSGTFDINAGQLITKDVISTLIGCPEVTATDGTRMVPETAFHAVLNEKPVLSLSSRGDLTLTGQQGRSAVLKRR